MHKLTYFCKKKHEMATKHMVRLSQSSTVQFAASNISIIYMFNGASLRETARWDGKSQCCVMRGLCISSWSIMAGCC